MSASSTPAATRSDAVAELEDLTVTFGSTAGDVTVVNGVSFRVGRGEIVAMVGESGSGKSMTGLAMMGLLPHGARPGGRVTVAGTDILASSEKQLRHVRGAKVAMVFQDPMTALNPVLKVGDQIDEALTLHHRVSKKAARERTLEVLNLVGVPAARERAEQYPHQWSGGMRQRAVIAMALMDEPDVIIADEPTTALDVTVQAQVLEVLQDVRERTGVGILLITHDLGIVAEVADRVLVMYAGRIVEQGSTAEIFARTRHPYTRALMVSRAAWAMEHGTDLHAIPGRPPSPRAPVPGCSFHPRCPLASEEAGCLTAVPPLRAVDGERHRSACHRAELLADETDETEGIPR
ncbi:ABC transporter ATP-binding protein [Nigerium massiliense]|uniref:ABC transporter ATP-binding protein n=1 Tax=Nigerium massiliense TaxID=1522317 RepID=UPI000694341E|nr:ABC transporter ATP-binding protein [Nigerium massiliense]